MKIFFWVPGLERFAVKPKPLASDQRADASISKEVRTKEEGSERVGRMARVLKDWLAVAVRVSLVALAAYVFLFQVSVVHGQSMEPNFHELDRLLLDKVTLKFREPQRGEVI